MLNWIWLIPLLPLSGFVLLVALPLLLTQGLSERGAAIIGVGSVALAALLTALIAVDFLNSDSIVFIYTLGEWISVDNFTVSFSYYLDGLSLVMLSVITGVGFLIHCFSVGYMQGDSAYSRYFAYLNLFIAAMLVLVLADNFLLLYLGWEGVGLCSFLLIGFWYKKPENGLAARKAFVVTRVGDVAMALGLFLLFKELGSLNIQESMQLAQQHWPVDSTFTFNTATLAALLLLGGAVGKSAQLPLQTWLPDAMAGPTPVSALIHAATMVTAGVYLIARSHALFELSSLALFVVAGVGAFTLLLAACSALMQTDIKRVLAYSTISQLGYMFFALGVGAWSAGIFHLVTHAFFKALLFLAAGQVILSVQHQQDMFAMGGLRKKLPLAFWCFVIGCACLSSLPLTSGFFSKEAILIQAYDNQGVTWFWLMALCGAFITALYSFRMLFLVFMGEEKTPASSVATESMRWPLIILCGLALLGGLLSLPLDSVFNETRSGGEHRGLLEPILIAIPIAGVALAAFIFIGGAESRQRKLLQLPMLQLLQRWWLEGWWFDRLYTAVFVTPFSYLASKNKNDVVDDFYIGVIRLSQMMNRWLTQMQSGQLRWYAASMVVGMVFVLAIIWVETPR